MTDRQRGSSPLLLGCLTVVAIFVLLLAAVVVASVTGLITPKSSGSVTLPNGAVVPINSGGSGFGAGGSSEESFVNLGSFVHAEYVFTRDEVLRDGQVLGKLDPAEQRLTLEAIDGGYELRSDTTGRVIFTD